MKKKLNSDENYSEHIRMNQYAKFFKISIVENQRIPSTPFLRMRIKETKIPQTSIAFQRKILERLIKTNNELSTIYLPEVVDIYTKEKNKGTYVYVVKELVKGAFSTVNLYEYIRTGSLRVNDSNEDKIIGNQSYVISNNVSKKEFIQVNKFVDRVLLNIIDFEEYLFNHGLVHVGIFPSHISYGIDSILKFFGERYIVHQTNGYIDDKVITNPLYGSLINPRYTPEELVEYLSQSGNKKVKALSVISYQLSVLLFDTITEFEYTKEEFTEKVLQKASLKVPLKMREPLKETIKLLASKEFRERLTNFDEIKKACLNFREENDVNSVYTKTSYIMKGVNIHMDKKYISDDLFQKLFDDIEEDSKNELEIKVYVKKAVVIQKSFSYDEVTIGRSSGSFEADVDLSAYIPDKFLSKKTLIIARYEDKYYLKNVSDIPVFYFTKEDKEHPMKLKKDEQVEIYNGMRAVINLKREIGEHIGLEISINKPKK